MYNNFVILSREKIEYNSNMKIREIQCKSAVGKCGFPGGGLAINPYVGRGHACVYCYARFVKRFTGHTEKWGEFVDARVNIADVLAKQLKSKGYRSERIYIGTVTDPYQTIEAKWDHIGRFLLTPKPCLKNLKR